MAKYGELCARVHVDFQPFGVTTFSTLGPRAQRALAQWAAVIAGESEGLERQQLLRSVPERISMGVMRIVSR